MADVMGVVARDDGPGIIVVEVPGLPGPRGYPGASGSGALPATSFSYGDASPRPLLTLPAGGFYELILCQLEIEIPFNGAGATIRLGTQGEPEAIMAAWQNDPASTLVFENSPRVALAGGTDLYLSVNPGAGATQGRGEFVLQVVPII